MGARVFVSQSPVEGGDVQTAAGLTHQVEPGLEDGRVCGAGVKVQPLRDALHQHNPDRGHYTNTPSMSDVYTNVQNKTSSNANHLKTAIFGTL